MNEKTRQQGRDFARFLESLPDEVREATNREVLEEAKAEHQEFREAYRRGDCYLCGRPFASFDAGDACLHWLLKPNGFTKHHFMAVTARYDIFQVQSFLRWVANEEAFAKNINDLSDEGTGKLIELTIQWRDCEWAFSCGEGDYRGHDGGAGGSDRPHYHFQMRYKKQAFIRYNDFHISLQDKDVHRIEAGRAMPDRVKSNWYGGEGMSDLLQEGSIEHLLGTLEPTTDVDGAAVRLQTIMVADEGKPFTGEEIAALVAEAREKGVPMASLAQKLGHPNTQTFVMPGEGVVEQAPRSGGRKRRRE